VIERDGRFVLVAGRNRIEALRLLGIPSVLVRCVDFDDVEARMWTISENLFRAELTVGQRADQVAEYARLANEKRDIQSGQVAQNESKREDGRGHRHEGGDSRAARDLGISRDEVRRAKTIAALPEQTKQAAREIGLDDNQSALLKAARAPTPEAQIAVLAEIKDRGRVADAPSAREPDDSGHEPPEDPPPIERIRSAGAKPLRDLVGISGGELARWIKITTPNDRPHVIGVLEMAAGILRDKLEESAGDGSLALVEGAWAGPAPSEANVSLARVEHLARPPHERREEALLRLGALGAVDPGVGDPDRPPGCCVFWPGRGLICVR
jgi:ParB-like chromosome segregation protein Spo0J